MTRPRPILCAVAALLFLALGGCSGEEFEPGATISALQLAERIRSGAPPYILDVRTREEFVRGHIKGAVNIPHDELQSRLTELPIAKSEEVVVYCEVGGRAGRAEVTLREGGYSDVRDLAGHWRGWRAADDATLPIDSPGS